MTSQECERYSRQILFSGIGEEGQERLRAARVAVVGCGALGSFHADALARAGAGTLVLIDRDYVETSNLQRQWLYEEADARDGLPKAIAAQRALARINSGVVVEAHVSDLTAANIVDLLAGVALILDGTDNFETRYLINDYAVREGLPWVYGAAVGSYGLTMPVVPGVTACLKCVYPEAPSGVQPTCETAGVLNAVTAAVAALQVGMALKILSGHAGDVARRITTIDVWSGVVRQIEQPAPDASCPACGERRFMHLDEARRVPTRESARRYARTD